MASIQSSLRTQLGHGDQHSPAAIVTRAEFAFVRQHVDGEIRDVLPGPTMKQQHDDLYERRTHSADFDSPREGPSAGCNGTVVGAFSFAQYDQSSIRLESGDLLRAGDGRHHLEPENQFGEMFGEDRFIDLVSRADRRASRRLSAACWTRSGSGPDRMS